MSEAPEQSTPADIGQQTLHAVRAIGVLLVRSAIGGLVGGVISLVGLVILTVGNSQAVVLGQVVVAAGLLTVVGFTISAVAGANRELRASGARGLNDWMNDPI